MTENIPITAVDIGEAEVDRVVGVLRSGQLAQGPVVAELEAAFAARHGVRHAVAVNNGTTALVAALQAIGVGPGDEVITSPFTFVATLNAILEAGATARFADIGDDYCVDPSSVASLIGPRTAAIMPVHLYGLPADMVAISSLAQQHGLQLVEDAAQAHGASIDGRSVGSWGLGCFSLYATKNITSGEGGMVTTDSDDLADRLRLLRNQGMRARYQYELAGHNYRMTDVQAAIALPQLARLDDITTRRRANAARLTAALADTTSVVTPSTPPGRAHVWHQYTVALSPEAPLDRDEFVAALHSEGVGAGVYYPKLVHDYECYVDNPAVVVDATPRAASAARRVVSLPVHQRLTDDQVDRVAAVIKTVLK